MNKHLITVTADGTTVYIDLVASSAGKQIGQQPHLLTLAQEILSGQRFSGDHVVVETNMGRMVGTNSVVKTSDKYTVFYAKPVGSDDYRRYVKNHSYPPTRYLTLELIRLSDEAASYALTDISSGRSRPAMPNRAQTDAQFKVSHDFWSDHAYIWEPKSCQSTSITKDCPWQRFDDAPTQNSTVKFSH